MRHTLFSLVLCCGLILAACSRAPEPTPLPIVIESGPSASPSSASATTVTASGVIAPIETAQLGFGAAGRVSEVNTSPGASISQGDLLVSLEGRSRLEAAISAARLEILEAERRLKALREGAPMSAAQAKKTAAEAQEAIRSAERRITNMQTAARQYYIDQAKANVVILEDKLDDLRKDYKPYEKKPEDNLTRAALLSRLAQTEQEYEAAVRLANSLQDVTVDPVELAQAEADLYLAQTTLDQANADYEMYLEGPDPEEVALAQARIENGIAQLAAAQAALDEITLLAPFDGTAILVEIVPGEMVVPGQTAITLSDLSALRVETTDLSERDIARVSAGQKAQVYIEALDMNVEGEVTGIAPQADVLGGDVVYTVYIELDQNPAGLRWGMSVEVEIETG